MKHTYLLTACAWIGLTAIAVMPTLAQQTPQGLFERARLSEESNQLQDAIKLYEQVVAQSKGDLELAARARFQIGVVYQKLNSPEAQKVYEKVLSDYPNQLAASDAKQRLVALTGSPSLGLTKICSDCTGGVSEATISSDGRYMVATEGTDGDLVIRDLMTNQITRPPATRGTSKSYARMPLLSPDSRLLTYAWKLDNGGRGYELRIMSNEAAGQPRVLVNNPEYESVLPMAWSQDGKSVLVGVGKPDRTWQLAWVSHSNGSIQTIKSLGWRFSAAMGRPSVSRDGYIAYSALVNDPGLGQTAAARNANADQHIYVLKADGSAPEIEVVKGASVNESPIWSPDGKSLLFVSNRGGAWGIWSIAFQGGKAELPTQVMPATGRVRTVGMTSSGSYYYEQLQSAAGPGLLVGTLNNVAPMVSLLTVDDHVWSPDGKRIAFFGRTPTAGVAAVNPFGKNSAATGILTLMVYSVDTADDQRYSPDPALQITQTHSPVWFHDGKALLLGARDSKGFSLQQVDLRTGQYKQIVPSGETVLIGRAISSDDKTIYASESELTVRELESDQVRPELKVSGRIVAIDVNNGQRRTLATGLTGKESMILSGDTLYMSACDRTPGDPVPPKLRELLEKDGKKDFPNVVVRCHSVVAVDTRTGTQRPVLTVPAPQNIDRFALSSDGHKLVLEIPRLTGLSSELDLFRVGVDGKDYRKLYGPLSLGAGATWAPDGTAVIALDNPSAAPAIVRIPDGDSGPVTRQQVPSALGFSMSPDGLHYALESLGVSVKELWALKSSPSNVK